MTASKTTPKECYTYAMLASFLSAVSLAAAVGAYHIPDQDPGDALIRQDIRQQCIQSHIHAEFTRQSTDNISLSSETVRYCVESNYTRYVEEVKNTTLHQILSNGISILLSLCSFGLVGHAVATYGLGKRMEQSMSGHDNGPGIP